MRAPAGTAPPRPVREQPPDRSVRDKGGTALRTSRRPRRCAPLLMALVVAVVSLLAFGATPPVDAQPAPPQPAPRIDPDLQRQALRARIQGTALYLQNDLQGALARYEEALNLYRRAGDLTGEAGTLDDIAGVHERLADYARSLALRQEALAVARAADARNDESEILRNLGQLYNRLGQYGRARDLAQQALAIAQEEVTRAQAQGDAPGATTAEHNVSLALRVLAFAYDGLGEYARALEINLQLLALTRERIARAEAGEESLSLLANQLAEQQTLNAIGSIYSALGLYEQALEYFLQAFRLAVSSGDIEGAIVYQNNIAFVYSRQDRIDEALALYEEALDVVQERGDRFTERPLLNNIGSLYERKGEYARALTFYERARELARQIGDRAGEGVVVNNIGFVRSRLGDDAGARDALEQALVIARETGYRTLEQTVLDNLGRLLERWGQLQDALDYSLQSIAVAEDVRTLARVEEFRASVAAEASTTYDHAVSLLLRMGRTDRAFDLSERGRARSFLDQLGNARLDLRRAGGALAAREEELRRQVSALDQLVRQERSQPADDERSGRIASLDAELAARQAEYADVLTRLRLADPESASLVSVSPLTLGEVQPLLDGDTTLVSYFVTPETTFAFVIARDSFRSVDLGVGEVELRRAIDEFRGFTDLADATPASLQQLYTWLIAPLRDFITTPVVGIIPHSVLHYLPFAALSDGRGSYFGDEHPLFTLPSVSALPFIQAKRKAGGGDVLALAQSQAEGLPPLRWADVEAQAIADLFDTRALIGSAATETTAKTQAGRSAVLHVAAHGELNPRSPLFSRIFLAPDSENDGSLTVGEVYGLDFRQTDLAVLSACETQLGAQSRGDDIVGLTRAFIYAGAPTVVASLWSVNDRATAVFMTAFYRQLSAGLAKAAALQAAQAETRASFPHPFYWAAFVLTGDPGPLAAGGPSSP